MQMYRPSIKADGALGDLLIVAHGPGRGRENPFLPLFLAHLDGRRPDLATRTRVHLTGSGEPVDLDGVGLILCFLADPLRQLFPQCYAEAKAIEARAEARGIEVLNRPDALGATSKLAQNARWRAMGLPCAEARGFDSAESLRAAMPGLRFPLILRYDLGHALESTFLCRTPEDAETALTQMRFPATALEFMDIRAAWRETGARSLFSRLHHKKRAFVVCGEVINSHLMFAEDPFVGLQSCTFTRQARWKRRLAARFGYQAGLLRKTVAADLAYFAGPADAPQTLAEATRALGLDMVAIDYASMPDGSVKIWEANPFFWLPHGSRSVLAGERQAVRRVDETLDRFADILVGRIAHAAAESCDVHGRVPA